MADKEGLVFKFFKSWKDKKLNSLAKKMLRDSPSLEKDMRRMDKAFDDAIKAIRKNKNK